MLTWVLAVVLGVGHARNDDARLAYAVRGAPTVAVEVGEPFELVVTRSWSGDLEPEPFSERRLAPLRVVEVDVRRDLSGGRTVETRRLRAHAFDVGTLVLDDLVLVARDVATGGAVEARAEPLELTVRSSLTAVDDGALEVPLAPRGPARRSMVWTALALLCVLFVSIAGLARVRTRLVARRQDRDARTERAARRAAEHAAAVAALVGRLERLGERAAQDLDPSAAAQWNGELWSTAREALGLVCGVSFAESTVDEVASALERHGAPDVVRELVGVGRAVDRVRFARASDGPRERASRVERARAAVQLLERSTGPTEHAPTAGGAA
ncbi:hypothetical protein [Planctomycetes bacterium Pla163]|uniref:hypothetical protein n=1 Tax=Rohdeia mirabilis TaxID=2528008 RepID=UPI0011A688C1